MSIEGLRRTLREHVFYTQGRFPAVASKNEIVSIIAFAILVSPFRY